MAHEKSITVESDGVYYNIPSVVGGKQLSQKQAFEYAVKTKTLGQGYESLNTAIEAAKTRSHSFDKTMPSPGGSSLDQPRGTTLATRRRS